MFPLVSIIIPVYNVKDFLCESIDSAIHQTYKNLEIIIIDDGSTDGSEKICDDYQNKDKRVHVIHQANRGLSGARNTGLDNMHGDIVAFLDSDDAFLPEMIEVMVKEMIQNDAEIVACGFYSCRTTKRMQASQSHKSVQLRRQMVSSDTALKYLINNRISINVWSKLYKRDVFENLRFPEGRNHEDLILTPYLIEKAYKVMLIEKQFVLYRNRKHNITSSVNPKNISDWIYAIKQWEDFAVKRTPGIFSKADLKCIRETNIRGLLGKKLILLSNKSKKQNLSKSLCEIEDAIQLYTNKVSDLSLKLKTYSLLVNNVPKLTNALINGFYAFKRGREHIKSTILYKRLK